MNIGFVSTWFERGAAYVTKQYVNLLKDRNNVYVYARGGERYAKGSKDWDFNYVTWGTHLGTVDEIEWKDIKKWIKTNNIEVIFFNEQRNIEVLIKIKIDFPNIKLGSYIDYYKQDSVKEFEIYDFLICNTKRHYEVFEWHSRCYYIPWGTDIETYKPMEKELDGEIKFFHSAGMSTRKGTKLLIEEYIKLNVNEGSKLIIHTQLPIRKFTKLGVDELKAKNIEVIEGTVTAPGLYYLGDIYVYPTELEGLGLTLYEALSCGLPVITTNNAPMNEVINSGIGKLVQIEKQISRADAYYWPLSIISRSDLGEAIKYYIENKEKIKEQSILARNIAVEKYNWNDRKHMVNEIFEKSIEIQKSDIEKVRRIKKNIFRQKIYKLIKNINDIVKIKWINKIIFKVFKKMKSR